MLRKHKNLDKKIWVQNDKLHSDVQDMLLSIVWCFIDFLRNKHDLHIKNSDVKDIILFGSMTNYFYTKKSDIDICIVLDMTGLSKQYPNLNIAQTLKLYYYDWAMIHLCNIKGRKIDLNIEDMNNNPFGGRYRTGSNYSLLNKEWIFKQTPISDDDFKKIRKSGIALYKRIMQDYNKVKHDGFQMQDMEILYKNIMASKRATYNLNYQQVITPMYIAFNELKKHHIIDKMHKKIIKIQTKKFTLK
jgi:predicted nucleotidyltransferase